MNIKHLLATGLVTLFAGVGTMTGCTVVSDPDSVSDMAEDEISDVAEAVAVAVNCPANSPKGYNGPSYSNAVAATTSTVIDAINNENTSYDISGYCATALNARRQTVHTRTKNGVTTTIQPYYNLYDAGIVPAYSAMSVNVNATTGSSVCRLCKGLADAKAQNHAGYGMCYGISPDATGPTTNEVSVGWCPAAIGKTAKEVVDGCLNGFENEAGLGHKGPIVWDSTRAVSCTIGVYVDPVTNTKKAGVSINYSYPPRNGATPNGGNCKVSGECRSRQCDATSGRCVGFTSSIPKGSNTVTPGVSACPAADSKNCTEHSVDDPGLCFSKNLACASGVCSGGTCAKGAAGKLCVKNGDCTSNVCTGGLCQ